MYKIYKMYKMFKIYEEYKVEIIRNSTVFAKESKANHLLKICLPIIESI